MKKILQISNYQYPHIGGIEQVARDIADSLLDDKEIEQKMICFNEDAQDGNYLCHRKETMHDSVDGVEGSAAVALRKWHRSRCHLLIQVN